MHFINWKSLKYNQESHEIQISHVTYLLIKNISFSLKKKLLGVFIWNWKSFLQLFSKPNLKHVISFMNRKSSCGYVTHLLWLEHIRSKCQNTVELNRSNWKSVLLRTPSDPSIKKYFQTYFFQENKIGKRSNHVVNETLLNLKAHQKNKAMKIGVIGILSPFLANITCWKMKRHIEYHEDLKGKRESSFNVDWYTGMGRIITFQMNSFTYST
jgi:hypothetical protein